MDQIRRSLYLLLTGMTVSAVLLMVSAAKAVEHEKSAAVVREAAMQEREPVGYVLREYEGHVALYREHAAVPYQVLDTEVWLLSEKDRTALAEGITAENEAELRTLLEDWDIR